jgi:hypothetical protein
MSKSASRPWYSEGSRLVRRVDSWVSRRPQQPQVGQEADWLGWDGWVRTDEGILDLIRARRAAGEKAVRTASQVAAPRGHA